MVHHGFVLKIMDPVSQTQKISLIYSPFHKTLPPNSGL